MAEPPGTEIWIFVLRNEGWQFRPPRLELRSQLESRPPKLVVDDPWQMTGPLNRCMHSLFDTEESNVRRLQVQ